jgi:hypothetical protein
MIASISQKFTDIYLNSKWWLPPFFEKGSSRTVNVDIFRKSIIDFLIVSFIDIYHSLSVKRREVKKISSFPPNIPQSHQNLGELGLTHVEKTHIF